MINKYLSFIMFMKPSINKRQIILECCLIFHTDLCAQSLKLVTSILVSLKTLCKRNSKFFKGGVNYLFNSVDRIAFWCNGNTKVVVVISVFEEASILFIFSRFLGIGHSEKVIFTHKPISKATVLNN